MMSQHLNPEFKIVDGISARPFASTSTTATTPASSVPPPHEHASRQITTLAHRHRRSPVRTQPTQRDLHQNHLLARLHESHRPRDVAVSVLFAFKLADARQTLSQRSHIRPQRLRERLPERLLLHLSRHRAPLSDQPYSCVRAPRPRPSPPALAAAVAAAVFARRDTSTAIVPSTPSIASRTLSTHRSHRISTMNSNVRAFVAIASLVDDLSLELDDDPCAHDESTVSVAVPPCVTASRGIDTRDTIARIRSSLDRRASRDGVDACMLTSALVTLIPARHSLVRHARAHVFVLDRARETDRVSPVRREVREDDERGDDDAIVVDLSRSLEGC